MNSNIMNNKKNWLIVSIGSICLSLLSLLLPVLSYRSARSGVVTGYNIFGLIRNSDMVENVFAEYNGDFLRGMSYSTVSTLIILLSIVGVAAIFCAFIGIRSMAKQYESAWPFRLALSGLVGTAIPSLTLLVLFFFSQNQYDGVMTLGTYIIVTPIAMVLACITIVNRHRLTQEEKRLQAEASSFIRPAGDLPLQ